MIEIVILAAVLGSAPAVDEVKDPLPYDASLPDPVFSILVGLISSDTEGRLSGDHLRQEIEGRGRKSQLPADLLVSLERQRTSPGEARVSLLLKAPMDRPIPYSILWYRPGRMQASAETVYTERSLGRLLVPHVVKGHAPRVLDVTQAYLFLLENGGLAVDIDAWIDKLMGAALDDTDVHTFALALFQGRWLGIAVGRNPSAQPRQGVFDLRADKVMFPIPSEIRSIVRTVRDRANSLRRLH